MNTILTDGVSIRDEAGKPVVVTIELVEGEPGSDAAALLAQAWAQLGQAISANKQPGAWEQNSDATEHAPGAGAWWSE
jgi:hypothetical protein